MSRLLGPANDHDADVVLGPASDGGYYLVAMRSRHAFMFEDMPWGSANIMQLTESRLQAQGVNWHRLAVRRDLDTPEDYLALRDAYCSFIADAVSCATGTSAESKL